MISAHRYFNISWYSFAISLNYCLILEHYLCITFVTYSKSVLRSEFLILSMIMCSSELYVNGTCLCCIFIPLPPNTPHQKVTQVTGQQMQVINSNIFVDVHWDDLFYFFFFYKTCRHGKNENVTFIWPTCNCILQSTNVTWKLVNVLIHKKFIKHEMNPCSMHVYKFPEIKNFLEYNEHFKYFYHISAFS